MNRQSFEKKANSTGIVIAIYALLLGMMLPVNSRSGTPTTPKPKHHTQSERMSGENNPIGQDFGKGSVYFEENRGQFDKKVKFKANGPGYTLFLTQTDVVYVLREHENRKHSKQTKKTKLDRPRNEDFQEEIPEAEKAVAIYMRIVGANENALMAGGKKQVHKKNYFRGNDPEKWQKDVPTFGKVRYENVYEGIDLEFYGKEDGQIEHDFIVKPNADLRQIELEFEGAEKVEIDSNGDLIIETEIGQIRQSAPYSFQKTDGLSGEVESGYELLDENRVRFNVGNYDRTKDLVIDPVLTNLAYSTLLGGENNDFGDGIEVDSMGNSYVTGLTLSEFFPTTPGSFDPTNFLSADAFITKMNPGGDSLIYSTFLGGFDYDSANDIAIDPAGNAYITGTTSSTNFPTTVGAFDTTHNGLEDGFVTKLNANGNNLIYSTYVGGFTIDESYAIDIDQAGNAYITGPTISNPGFPTTLVSPNLPEDKKDSEDSALLPSDNIFVSKFNSTGSGLLYSKVIGGSSEDIGYDIVVEGVSEFAFVTGSTQSTDLPTTPSTFDSTLDGGMDCFILVMDDLGNLNYLTYFGGSGNEKALGITIDSNFSVYLTGDTDSSDFPITTGVLDESYNGNGDIFVTKFSYDFSLIVFSTFLGGTNFETATDIEVDSNGNTYIVGYTDSTDFQLSSLTFQSFFGGGFDGIISKINGNGSNLSFSTYFGGETTDRIRGIDLDSEKNIYLTGDTSGGFLPPFPTTVGVFQRDHNGGTEAFISKFGNFAITGQVIDQNGAPIEDALVALSGRVSNFQTTGADGKFSILNAVHLCGFDGCAYSVTATKSGVVFNPSIFNIGNLGNNHNLLFVGGGSPSGGGGNQLSFSVSNFNVIEPKAFAEIKVWRGQSNLTDRENLVGTVSIDFQTSSGTASSGSDYTDTSGTLTFNDGEFEKSFLVPIIDDISSEGNETVNLALNNPTGGAILGTNSNATLTIEDNNEPALQTLGYQVDIVSSSNFLKGKHLAGMAVNSSNGTIYIATDDNVIKAPNGQTNNCGSTLYQNSFDLLKLAADGSISLIGNYNIRHRGLVNLEFNPNDGEIYIADTNQKVYRINPANGQQNTFNSDVGFSTETFGLQFNSEGDLIMMAYGDGNSFYRVPSGSGSTFLGSYPYDNTNFGDRFGIQPDGDYIVFSDASHQSNARDFEIDTTGHTEGQPYNFAYISNNNIRTLGSSWMTSNGAVDPFNGDVYTAGGNCAAGSSVILRTPLSGTPLMMNSNSQFINNIGNGQTNGAENFDARGVTDLDFGPKRNGQTGYCLYFLDDFNDVVYQSCALSPTAANVRVGGRVLSLSGDRAIPRATVTIVGSDGASRSVRTNQFGYYAFDDVRAGATYTFTVHSKGLEFEPRTVNITDNMTQLNFRPTSK